MKKRLLDIKTVMKVLDTKDYNWYDNLTEEERKEVSPWQLMRFMSSVDNKNREIIDFHLVFINDLVNVNFNTLREHPELQLRLMQVVGMGIPMFHPWIPPAKREKIDKVQQWLETVFPEYSEDEIQLVKTINSKKELKQLASDHGLTDKEIKEIFG